MIDRRPALIARCAGASDVIQCANFARENNVLVAVLIHLVDRKPQSCGQQNQQLHLMGGCNAMCGTWQLPGHFSSQKLPGTVSHRPPIEPDGPSPLPLHFLYEVRKALKTKRRPAGLVQKMQKNAGPGQRCANDFGARILAWMPRESLDSLRWLRTGILDKYEERSLAPDGRFGMSILAGCPVNHNELAPSPHFVEVIGKKGFARGGCRCGESKEVSGDFRVDGAVGKSKKAQKLCPRVIRVKIIIVFINCQ